MAKMFDKKNVVGAYDVSTTTTGVAFDLLDPNNPVYVLGLPGMDDGPVVLRGQKHKTFSDMLKALNIKFDIELKTGDEDDPYQEIQLTFEKMSDFKEEAIIKRVKELKRLQEIQEKTAMIVRKAKDDSKFAKVFEDEQIKEDFLAFLDSRIEMLEKK